MPSPGPGRRVQDRTWLPRKGVSVRLPSELVRGPARAWQGVGGQAASRSNPHDDAEHSGHAPPHHHLRRAAGAAGGAADSDGWKWQEPVLDGSLSTADRAVLALARAAANLSDKLVAERVASSHALTMVTNSEVCVGPLLPPFGSTLEDDGEEGDGMALPLPGRLAGEQLRWEAGRSSLAGSASALLSAVLAGGAAGGAASPRDSAPEGGPGRLGAGLHHVRAQGGMLGAPQAHGSYGGAAAADDKLRHLALLVAEGGGGDEDQSEDEEVLQAFAADRNGGGGVAAVAGAQLGIMGAAAAALTRVARAASSTAADVPAPVGRVAAGAASAAAAAAQAAVATAARATAHMLPHYGDPSSSWLVADDAAGGVRYIVISAGADLRRRSPHELTSDLVTFETYDLGVKVNKRLYSEASALYDRFMPLVMDFLEAVPDGNICFGGQGVGGSLAVCLQLMCSHRGLRFARLLPAVAVDAPAVLAQVPREQRRMWGQGGGSSSREQQRQLPQESLEDTLEDLMQRSVLEELGLPQDAVRNLVLAHPTAPPSQSPPSSWYGTGHAQSHHATGPMLVLAAAEAAAGGGGGGGSAAAAASPAVAQVFRLVGRLVQVETVGSLNDRTLSSHAAAGAASSLSASAAASAHGQASSSAGGGKAAAVVETDGGTGEFAAAAAAAAAVLGSSGNALGQAAKRLDVAMLGSIATAAATAAATSAVEQLRFMGAGTMRAVAAADRGRAAAATAAAVTAVGAAAAAAVGGSGGVGGALLAASADRRGSVRQIRWPPLAEGHESAEEDDACVWGV